MSMNKGRYHFHSVHQLNYDPSKLKGEHAVSSDNFIVPQKRKVTNHPLLIFLFLKSVLLKLLQDFYHK